MASVLDGRRLRDAARWLRQALRHPVLLRLGLTSFSTNSRPLLNSFSKSTARRSYKQTSFAASNAAFRAQLAPPQSRTFLADQAAPRIEPFSVSLEQRGLQAALHSSPSGNAPRGSCLLFRRFAYELIALDWSLCVHPYMSKCASHVEILNDCVFHHLSRFYQLLLQPDN